MYSKPEHELEEVENRIAKAYKKVWMLKSIGSRSVQMNPMIFSRGYWAVVVSKLCYGMFLVNLKKRSLDKLDKMQDDVARNIQGLAPNTPAIVAIGRIKWWRISTHIAVEAVMFAWQLLSLPIENVNNKIFVQRLVKPRSDTDWTSGWHR